MASHDSRQILVLHIIISADFVNSLQTWKQCSSTSQREAVCDVLLLTSQANTTCSTNRWTAQRIKYIRQRNPLASNSPPSPTTSTTPSHPPTETREILPRIKPGMGRRILRHNPLQSLPSRKSLCHS